MELNIFKNKIEKWALLGASRGLGFAFFQKALGHNQNIDFLVSARNLEEFNNINNFIDIKEYQDEMFFQKDRIIFLESDFSNKEKQDLLIKKLLDWHPDRIFYFAGGGPYGSFATKKWSDHLWSFEVTFLFPAKLLHALLEKEVKPKQMVFIGSSIAENDADKGASSYAASKHALLGLIRSVQLEYLDQDIRLYSPPYMDTKLLPKNSWPRKMGLAKDVQIVADDLFSWIMSERQEKWRRADS